MSLWHVRQVIRVFRWRAAMIETQLGFAARPLVGGLSVLEYGGPGRARANRTVRTYLPGAVFRALSVDSTRKEAGH